MTEVTAKARELRAAGPGDLAALESLQHAAYTPNVAITNAPPIPLQWDYREVLAKWRVLVIDGEAGLDAALIYEVRPDDLYIENISVAPHAQRRGLGDLLLARAEAEARAHGKTVLRLLTNEKLTRNTGWYGRRGFTIELVEVQPNRRVVHMIRHLD